MKSTSNHNLNYLYCRECNDYVSHCKECTGIDTETASPVCTACDAFWLVPSPDGSKCIPKMDHCVDGYDA